MGLTSESIQRGTLAFLSINNLWLSLFFIFSVGDSILEGIFNSPSKTTRLSS